MAFKFSAFLFLLVMPLASWSETRYVVQRGDTLLKVADRTLGSTDRKDPRRYELARKIQQMNPELKDPNVLEPGQTLIVPSPSTKTKAQAQAQTQSKATAEPKIVSESIPVATRDESAHGDPDAASIPAPAATPTLTAASLPEPADGHHSPGQPTYQPKGHESGHRAEAQVAKPHAAHAESHESGHSNFFFVQPRYQILEISTKDFATKTKASMKSKSSVGLDIQYGKILNEHFHLLFQAGVTHTQFDKIEGTGATINHDYETLKSFSAGIAYEATSRLHLDLMFMAAERTFIVPTTLPAYELKAILIPGAELNISFDLYKGESNIFGVSVIGEYLSTVAKDTVEYKSALESLAALYWKSNYGHDRVNYKATLTYKKGHQDTSLSEQHEDMTMLGVGFYF